MGRVSEFQKAKSYQKKKEKFQEMFPGMRIHALRNADEETRNKLLKDFKLERWYKAQLEAGNLGVKHGNRFLHPQEAHNVADIETTENQEKLQDLYTTEAQKGLGPLLERLRTPYTHPVNKRMEEIFGHLQNPIMQGLFAQEQPRGSLFPSAIEQEYRQGPPMGYQQQQQPSAFGDLLSALGGHAMNQYVDPWMQQQTQESLQNLYGQGQQGVGDIMQWLGGAAGNANQGLDNYIQGGLNMRQPQTWGDSFQQGVASPMYTARHPLELLQGLGNFAGNAYNKFRGNQ